MGSELSRSLQGWRSRKIRRVLLVGLDSSGKTTALQQLSSRLSKPSPKKQLEQQKKAKPKTKKKKKKKKKPKGQPPLANAEDEGEGTGEGDGDHLDDDADNGDRDGDADADAGEDTVGETVPTTDSEYREVRYKGLELLVTDVGGQVYLRPYWRHHYTGAQGVIFVVDSMDKERFQDATAEFKVLLVDEQVRNVPIVVFANKQDGPGAASVAEVRRALVDDNDKADGSRDIVVLGGSALTGDGIYESLDWLAKHMHRV